MFYGNVDRFKTVVGGLFSTVHQSTRRKRFAVGFSKCLTQYDLDQLLPILKADVVPNLFQCAYHVPSSWFDSDLIKLRQGANLPKQQKDIRKGFLSDMNPNDRAASNSIAARAPIATLVSKEEKNSDTSHN